LETFNPTIFGTFPRARVQRLAKELGLPGVGSSDAHVLEAIGRVYTTFPGRSAAALRRAILAGTVKPGEGEDHTLLESPAIFAWQMLRNLIGLGQDLRGVTRPIWTFGGERHGRDLGYPHSHKRPVKQK
jgi:predicted metal-dependent phosphoesterase TrpH